MRLSHGLRSGYRGLALQYWHRSNSYILEHTLLPLLLFRLCQGGHIVDGVLPQLLLLPLCLDSVRSNPQKDQLPR